jgi:hypothetical protein
MTDLEKTTSEGSVDWLDHLHLEIDYEGQRLYTGRILGDGGATHTMPGNGSDMINQGIDLGIFRVGDQKSITFSVTVDAGFMSAYDLREVSAATVTWVFYGVNLNGNGKGPDTGDIVSYGLWIAFVVMIVLCAFFYGRYRQIKAKGKCSP